MRRPGPPTCPRRGRPNRHRRLLRQPVAGGDRVLIRIRRDVTTTGQLNADPRARRRRTLHPDQRVIPLDERPLSRPLAHCDRPTSKSAPQPAVAVEHRYRHHTQVENLVSVCPRIRVTTRACSRTLLGRKAVGAPRPARCRRHRPDAASPAPRRERSDKARPGLPPDSPTAGSANVNVGPAVAGGSQLSRAA